MSVLLFANNASSTLAGPIGPTTTTIALASGTGSLFPAPGAGQYFVGTLTDANTGLLNEIVWVTNVSGDTLTVVRSQEGTSPQSWVANDLFNNLWTAGSAAVMAQLGQLQNFASNQAPDTGSVNNIVVALSPNPGSLASIAGAPVMITNIAATNTGPVTINLNGFGAQNLINPNDTAMSPGQLTAHSVAMVMWSAVQSDFVLLSVSKASSPPAPYINTTQGAYSGVPIPAGMTTGKLTMGGGGAGGGGTDGTHNAGGGQAGGILVKRLSGLIPGQTIAGSVGAGGAAGGAGASGSAGGDTTLQVNGAGTVYTAHGGSGGTGGSATPAGGSGAGTCTGGDLNLTGSAGTDGDATSVMAPAGSGGPGYLGAGAGRGAGGGGSPSNATSLSAGGAGSYETSSSGGTGFNGFVIVEWGP